MLSGVFVTSSAVQNPVRNGVWADVFLPCKFIFEKMQKSFCMILDKTFQIVNQKENSFCHSLNLRNIARTERSWAISRMPKIRRFGSLVEFTFLSLYLTLHQTLVYFIHRLPRGCVVISSRKLGHSKSCRMKDFCWSLPLKRVILSVYGSFSIFGRISRQHSPKNKHTLNTFHILFIC